MLAAFLAPPWDLAPDGPRRPAFGEDDPGEDDPGEDDPWVGVRPHLPGGAAWRFFSLRQVHGTRSWNAGEAPSPGVLGEGDILLTARPGDLLVIRTADCVPILLRADDPSPSGRCRAVAAVHAGWRGTAAGAVEVAVERLVELAGGASSGLRAAIGPAVGPCCYRVGPEVVAALEARCPRKVFLREDRGSAFVDLVAVNRWCLARLGVERIERVGRCTVCSWRGDAHRYHSHRREGPDAGRQGALVGMVP